jgi:hypothetical protein
MDLEGRAAAFYERVAAGGLERAFGEKARETRKRLRRLERARRELVSEMILESITGLDSEDYVVTVSEESGEDVVLAQARDLEATLARFYRDAAQKMPIREVARVFGRMAKELEHDRGEDR